MTVQAAQKFQTVLSRPLTKLQQDVPVDTNSIFFSNASDEELSTFAINQDQMIVLKVKSLTPEVGMQTGAGRYGTSMFCILGIQIWCRFWVDQAGRDTSWMTDATYGTATLIDKVMDSLEQDHPTDSNGNYLYIQPFRLAPGGWSWPVKKVGEWGTISSDWEMKFQHSLTLPVLSS